MNRNDTIVQALREQTALRAVERAAKEDRARALLAEGLPITTIAHRLGLTKDRVRTIRDGHGRSHVSPDTLEVRAALRETSALRTQEREARHARARALLLEGLDVPTVAVRMGMSQDTVRKLVRGRP